MKAIENVFQGTSKQIDLLNTLNGGSSQTTMQVEREDDQLVITLRAPGVRATAFNVLVEGSKLVIYTLLVSSSARQDDDENQRLAVPMFLRVLDIPDFVDSNEIEAAHEHGKVIITLPFKDKETMHRRIDIKGLFN